MAKSSQKPNALLERHSEESLPTITLKDFTPVTEQDDDKTTTESDLDILNNRLAMHHAALPHIRTLAGLCMESSTVIKLIDYRRKVKKLAVGKPNEKGSGNTFEVLE